MVRILTDSSCDLPQHITQALGVTVIPLYVTFEDGTVVRDGVDIDGDTFYARMQSCKKLPTTSQPSPEDFIAAFQDAKKAGDEVVAILVSAKLSGTYQSAQIAADITDFSHLHLVDSEHLCLTLGLLVQYAASLAAQGMSAAEMVTELERAKKHLHVYAVVDSLEYLRKGGRLPASAAIAGGLLGIKPIITLQDGKVQLGGKARGLPGAYLKLFEKIDADGGICTHQPYHVIYTLSKSEIEPIHRYYTRNLKIAPPTISRVGSVIGVHVGPGAFGIAYFDDAL